MPRALWTIVKTRFQITKARPDEHCPSREWGNPERCCGRRQAAPRRGSATTCRARPPAMARFRYGEGAASEEPARAGPSVMVLDDSPLVTIGGGALPLPLPIPTQADTLTATRVATSAIRIFFISCYPCA